jgi:hypothetical protein
MRQCLAFVYGGRRLAGIATIALLAAIAAGLGTARPALAAQQVITSTGPLTSIYITDTLNCQVAHSGDTSFEFYPSGSQRGDCGTFVVVGGTLYGFSTGGADSAASPRTVFTPVSQSAVLGSGTSLDPFTLVTVVDAGTTGIRLTETDSYVVGQESYRTDVQLANSGGTAQAVLLYRAADCFLQNSDRGFGRVGPNGAVACTVDQTATSRIEQWVPITGGSHYYETFYNTGWARIGAQLPFPDTCDCSTYEDNWAGLSWALTIPATSSLTVSHLTTFSPLGTTALSTTKTADSGTAVAGTADGYTITVSNGNASAVTLNSIFDDLAAGFTYTPGSTTGITTADPTVAAQHLTWSGPFTVPANGSVSLHFGVTVSSTPGDYFNSAGGDAGNIAVAGTGQTAKVTVTAPADQAISATGTAVSATEGVAFNGPVATFTDPDATATAGEYTATITWGDASSSPGTVSLSGGVFTVSGSHTYAEEGTDTVSVTITDADNPANTASPTSTAIVSDAALSASCLVPATSSTTFNGPTASFTDQSSTGTLTDFSATIDWGDGSSSPANGQLVTITGGPGTSPYTVSGSHTYASSGNFTITTKILDTGGSTITATCSTSTSSITLTPATATNAVGGSHTVTATVTSGGNPVAGTTVNFSIDSGPNAGKTGTGVTDVSGHATFTYTDTGGAGTDSISATFTDASGAQEKAIATKTWGLSDTTPPSCALTAVITGPPKQVQVTVQDADGGLQTILVTDSTNATTTVPAFTPGTTAPVVVTATKINQSQGARLGLQVTDMAGNVTNCDPSLLTVEAGKSVTIRRVPSSESTLTIRNGSSGLQKLRITVNGKVFVLHLRSNEVRLLDISSAMKDGSRNTISLFGYGRRGSSAFVVLSN